MSKFVIISSGRTGSHLLLTSLQSHPQINAQGEIFLTFNGSIKPLDALQSVYENSSKTSGFKIIYYQARKELSPIFGEDDVWHELQRQEDIKVIHSVRKNGLSRLISWQIAMETHVWQYYHGMEAPSIRVRIEPEIASGHWNFYDKNEKEIDAKFSNHPLLKVEYADLIQDIPGSMKKVQEFLGVAVHNLKSPLKRVFRPLDCLDNFEELKEYFEGSQWEWFFQDPSAG